MKGSFHITYEWWVTETPDDSIEPTRVHEADIHPEHVDELHKLARDRAIEMIETARNCFWRVAPEPAAGPDRRA